MSADAFISQILADGVQMLLDLPCCQRKLSVWGDVLLSTQ